MQSIESAMLACMSDWTFWNTVNWYTYVLVCSA